MALHKHKKPKPRPKPKRSGDCQRLGRVNFG